MKSDARIRRNNSVASVCCRTSIVYVSFSQFASCRIVCRELFLVVIMRTAAPRTLERLFSIHVFHLPPSSAHAFGEPQKRKKGKSPRINEEMVPMLLSLGEQIPVALIHVGVHFEWANFDGAPLHRRPQLKTILIMKLRKKGKLLRRNNYWR